MCVVAGVNVRWLQTATEDQREKAVKQHSEINIASSPFFSDDPCLLVLQVGKHREGLLQLAV